MARPGQPLVTLQQPRHLPPMPATAIECWHSQSGLAIAAGAVLSWTGQKSGTVLTPTSVAAQPTYAVDGTNFKSKPVVQFSRTTGKWVQGLLSMSTATPWIYLIYRYRAAPAGAVETAVYLGRDGANIMLAYQNDAFSAHVAWYAGQSANTTADTLMHRGEFSRDATAVRQRRDGGTQVTGPPGTTDSNLLVIALGGYYTTGASAVNAGNVNLGFVMVASSAPTVSELNALNAWAVNEWGTAP